MIFLFPFGGNVSSLRVLLHQLNNGSIKVIYFRSQLGFVSTAQDLQFGSQLEMQGGIDWGSCILQNEILKDMALWKTIETNSSLLKINGWKMKFPFGMAYFQGLY